jgi:hypothetical protein
MSSNTATNIPNENTSEVTPEVQSMASQTHATRTEVPLYVDPVTTVFPTDEELSVPAVKKERTKKRGSKSKVKKSSSSTSVKKTPKPKRGESKIPLSMEDLYLKENPFKIPNVDSKVGSSDKNPKDEDSKVEDVEASQAPTTVHTASNLEKGNSVKTLDSDNPKYAENLGLNDLNAVGNTAVDNMDEDDKLVKESNVSTDKEVQNSAEKKDVGPDVETSLDQQDKQGDVAQDVGTSTGQKDKQADDGEFGTDSGFQTADEFSAGKKTASKAEDVVSEDDEKTVDQEGNADVVDLEDVDSLEEPLLTRLVLSRFST